MYDEEDLLPISALQHLAFCPRQCALIHLEAGWEENRLTAEGRILHDRVHSKESETRDGVRIVRGLWIASRQLGISGIADIVEFHPAESYEDERIMIPGRKGWWKPFPVEYKRGRPKKDNIDSIQLCAQAICLEEMFSICIEKGALYYGKTRKRHEVTFGAALKEETSEMAGRLHTLLAGGSTPAPKITPKCKKCSLRGMCLPEVMAGMNSAEGYVIDTIDHMLREGTREKT